MTRRRVANVPELPVRDVRAPELLVALSHVQEAIRVADPRAVATDLTTRNPTLLALFRQERRILYELNRRQTLLSQGIGWTVLTTGDAGPANEATSVERSRQFR